MRGIISLRDELWVYARLRSRPVSLIIHDFECWYTYLLYVYLLIIQFDMEIVKNVVGKGTKKVVLSRENAIPHTSNQVDNI